MDISRGYGPKTRSDHATDVIAGAIVGVLASWYAYRQFYPVSPAP
jgi:hypothetical protein